MTYEVLPSALLLLLTPIPPTPPTHHSCLRPLTHEEIHQRHDLAKLRAMAKTAHAQAVAVDRTPSMRGVAEGGWVCLQVDRRMLSVGGRVYR